MTKKKVARRIPLRDDLEMANGCLDMVRETLEGLGLPMSGCPPMFYDDAIRQLAFILGRAAGMEKWVDIQRHVAEHEAAKLAPRTPGEHEVVVGEPVPDTPEPRP